MSGGYGLDADEVKDLQKVLNKASDELGMRKFPEKASLEEALTTQQVSPHENIEKTVEQVVLDLTKFVDTTYPRVVDAMDDFITKAHVTITTMGEGVAETGKTYEVNEEQVKTWLEKHPG